MLKESDETQNLQFLLFGRAKGSYLLLFITECATAGSSLKSLLGGAPSAQKG